MWLNVFNHEYSVGNSWLNLARDLKYKGLLDANECLKKTKIIIPLIKYRLFTYSINMTYRLHFNKNARRFSTKEVRFE